MDRITASGGATWTVLDYDGERLVTELNSTNAVLRRYVHGPHADEPLVWYEGSGTTDRRWLHSDERGSVTAISNQSGAALTINSYDEYGVPQGSNSGRFQYTGQIWLAELGMYYYKARMYSPTIGRFLQIDPIGYKSDLILYAYVENDPLDKNDPSGNAPGDPFDTEDQAAADVLSIINPVSIRSNFEFGGALYKLDGKYYATDPKLGTGDKSPIHYLGPKGSFRGTYHTHGDYSRKGRDGEPERTSKGNDTYNSDHFSDPDKANAKEQAKNNKDPNYKDYLGTPSGDLKSYSSSNGKEAPLPAPPLPFKSPSDDPYFQSPF